MASRLILTLALFLFGDLYERNSLRNLSAIHGNLGCGNQTVLGKETFRRKIFLDRSCVFLRECPQLFSKGVLYYPIAVLHTPSDKGMRQRSQRP